MGLVNYANNQRAIQSSNQGAQLSQQTLVEVQQLRREVAELKQLILNLK